MNRSKVAGIVILYNPEKSVIDNINSYLDQVGRLFIVDNSEARNTFISEFAESNQNVEYIFNNVNLGVATALNIGAKKSSKAGYSYLLTMDQDSKAPDNLVDTLLKIAENDLLIGIVSPLHTNKFDTHLKYKVNLAEKMIVMTSGNLLSLEAYKKIGDFCDDFFIDYVDIEYCFRMNYNHFKVIGINSIILQHNEANLSKIFFLFRTFYPSNNIPSRLYYKTRNLLYLRDMYKDKYSRLLRVEYDAYLRNIAKVFLFEKQKFLKLRMVFLGIVDYLLKKKGRKF